METASAHSLRVVQKLLWDAIAELLKPAEREEVKRAIGSLLIDENAGLFEEVAALADILGDVQLSTSALLSRQNLCSNPQRRMVEGEIQMLLDRLRGIAGATPYAGSAVKERDPESIIPKANEKDKAVLDYLVVTSSLTQSGEGRLRTPLLRPSTASSRPTTASSFSRPSTASSGERSYQSYDAATIVSTMHDKLNAYDVDMVKDVLRQALQEEKAALMEDVEYFTSLLEAETDMQAKASVPAPSLNELKEYSSKLHSAVQAEEARLEHEARVSMMFAAVESEPSKAGRLRSMVSASRKPVDMPSVAELVANAQGVSQQRGSNVQVLDLTQPQGQPQAQQQVERPKPKSASSAHLPPRAAQPAAAPRPASSSLGSASGSATAAAAASAAVHAHGLLGVSGSAVEGPQVNAPVSSSRLGSAKSSSGGSGPAAGAAAAGSAGLRPGSGGSPGRGTSEAVGTPKSVPSRREGLTSSPIDSARAAARAAAAAHGIEVPRPGSGAHTNSTGSIIAGGSRSSHAAGLIQSITEDAPTPATGLGSSRSLQPPLSASSSSGGGGGGYRPSAPAAHVSDHPGSPRAQQHHPGLRAVNRVGSGGQGRLDPGLQDTPPVSLLSGASASASDSSSALAGHPVGRLRPPSPARLRALVADPPALPGSSQGSITESPSITAQAAAAATGPSGRVLSAGSHAAAPAAMRSLSMGSSKLPGLSMQAAEVPASPMQGSVVAAAAAALKQPMSPAALGAGAAALASPARPVKEAPPVPNTKLVRSVVDQIEAEVDAVKGGVAAILAKHSYSISAKGKAG